MANKWRKSGAGRSATATVENWVAESEKRLEAVVKQSVQDLIANVQTPTAKGGRMRVDTGFLRASGQASLNGMPTGPSQKPSGDARYGDGSDVPTSVVLTIAKLKLGETIWFGWTANYAKYREGHDAFLRLGVQRWQQIVDGNVMKLRQRIK